MQLPEMTRFDVEALATPDAVHWPGYFWLWNDVLERETLFRQLRDMDSVGAKNVWILPVPADFRPNSMKTNLQPEYLSEEYLAILDDLVDGDEAPGHEALAVRRGRMAFGRQLRPHRQGAPGVGSADAGEAGRRFRVSSIGFPATASRPSRPAGTAAADASAPGRSSRPGAERSSTSPNSDTRRPWSRPTRTC